MKLLWSEGEIGADNVGDPEADGLQCVIELQFKTDSVQNIASFQHWHFDKQKDDM